MRGENHLTLSPDQKCVDLGIEKRREKYMRHHSDVFSGNGTD
jgi:hypothetical protein